MNRSFKLMLFGTVFAGIFCLQAKGANISVEMNTVSPTMSLHSLADDREVEIGKPSSRIYNFETDPGEYILTAYATNGTTVNGRLRITVNESNETQNFKVLTCTVYASNKNADNSIWQAGKDFYLGLEVTSKDGETVYSEPGDSSTSGRLTFLALTGNSYIASIIPDEKHQEEGYMTLFKGGTLTFNSNIFGAIPMGGDYSITVAEGAELALGMKFSHFTKFKDVNPVNVTSTDEGKIYKFRLANNQVYNYRAWRNGGLTHAGYFTMNLDDTKCPILSFTDEDFASSSPTEIHHNVEANDGYETGDLFVNINPQGYLRLETGETFDVHAMRSWELTDSATANYFIEPDFHYSVINLDGTPSEGIIEIENADTSTNPWSTIRAIDEGTVIVLVRYDGIALNYYSGVEKKNYMGGQNWGASWPENTAAFVVSVGQPISAAKGNMKVNEGYADINSKLSGDLLDAECDVIYFNDQEGKGYFTFTPESTVEVTVANPVITEQGVTYSGFVHEGITANNNGSFTISLTKGRNIVCLEDENGAKTYQVITAKPCSFELFNESDPERDLIFPGDKVRIQFSGLRHPANKLAGIYNMSAYASYNDVPKSTPFTYKANQYKFGSTPTAQAVTITIPEDYNPLNDNEWRMKKGCITISGFGDPIGSHRNISKIAGSSPNFTAISHKTALGILPEVTIPVTTKDILSTVDALNVSPEIIEIISVDGIRHSTFQPGINMVRYSDGSVKKVIRIK